MHSMKRAIATAIVSVLGTGLVWAADGQRHQPGRMGPRSGAAADPSHRDDMQVFHFLLANRAKIRRDVTNLPNGIATLTESDDPAVVAQLKTHVTAMVARMAEGRPIHARDPLFAELFRNAAKVTVRVEPLASGLRVVETSDDPHTVKLLHEHARVVTLFLERGMSEMHRDHPVPPR